MELVEKYRPSTLAEVRGNKKAISELRQWALDWPSDKKAALLYGKPGTGKTSAAIALANDLGWSVLELNASDKRTQKSLNQSVGEAAQNASFLDTRKLILLDEIDNLHGNSDRGGARAATELVKTTREPVILTANDLYGVSSTLRGYCKLISFFAIREDSIKKALVDIWHNEKKDVLRAKDALDALAEFFSEPEGEVRDRADYERLRAKLQILAAVGFNPQSLQKIQNAEDALDNVIKRFSEPKGEVRDRVGRRYAEADLAHLKQFFHDLGPLSEELTAIEHTLSTVDAGFIEQIARNAQGDLRSAINDFQAYLGGAVVDAAARDRVPSAFDLVRSILYDRDPLKPLDISYALDESPEDIIHWVDENVPRALEGRSLAAAFGILREADVYLGRTRRRQHYGLWKYALELMTLGVNVAARQDHQRKPGARYSPPTHWMRLGQTRSKRGLRDAVATKIARANHTSVAKARGEMLLLYKDFARRDLAGVAAAIDLSADELAYLANAKKDSAKIKKALQEAQRMRDERQAREFESENERIRHTGLIKERAAESESIAAAATNQKSDTSGNGNSEEQTASDALHGQRSLDDF
ncbi:MAG: replication factor C large subunit [Halobacteriota archaeon]